MTTTSRGKTNGHRLHRRYSIVFILLTSVSCSTSGPIETEQSDSKQPVVSTPAEFHSPLKTITEIQDSIEQSEIQFPVHPNYRSKQWQRYVELRQEYESLTSEQNALENQIETSGELALESGRSYSFDLESYCVHAGKSRPTHGDGLRIAPLRGAADSWITEILRSQGVRNVPQSQVQYLIWALLADVRFDELNAKDQTTLLRFFPDALTRFGNRRLENLAFSGFQTLFPDLSDSISSLGDLRNRILSLHDNAQDLESLLAPKSGRAQPIDVGWLKMNEGYFIHATADGFRQIHLDIYVPPSVGRTPSSKQSLVFQPWRWIGLPSQGQRLAISTKIIRKSKNPNDRMCERVSTWTPSSCRELSNLDRQKILNLADPKNFLHTRYQSPPHANSRIEDETDCSNFVNEIYRRAGFEFPYADTSLISCLKVFREIPANQLNPGDLVLYSGHIGVVNDTGDVMSATWGGKQRLSMLPSSDARFIPAIKILPKDQAHPGSWKALRWGCP